MTDPIRTPAEALEAAAQWHLDRADDCDRDASKRPDSAPFYSMRGLAHRSCAASIRQLAPRIQPAADEEALAKSLAEHMSKSHACDWPCEDPKFCQCIEEAAQAVKFLREAGGAAMIRVCEARDAKCPHGIDCPFWRDGCKDDPLLGRKSQSSTGYPLLDEMKRLRGVVATQAADIERLTRERERLALAICGGEDAPGYASAQSVETLETVARRAHSDHHTDIDRMMRAEARADAADAERDALREALRSIEGMVANATSAPMTADRWLDRIEERARAALGGQP